MITEPALPDDSFLHPSTCRIKNLTSPILWPLNILNVHGGSCNLVAVEALYTYQTLSQSVDCGSLICRKCNHEIRGCDPLVYRYISDKILNECIAPVYAFNIRMRVSELQMALHSHSSVEDLLELLPLENSTSPV